MTVGHGSLSRREPFISAILVIGLILVFGGASRADAMTQGVVRALAILAIGWTLLRPNWHDGGGMRIPILLMVAWLAMIALQLLPLPPEVWFALPGREQFLAPFEAAQVADAWRPLSMSPNWTRNSLFAAFVPLAVLLIMARLRTDNIKKVAVGILLFAAVSALFGVIQVAGNSDWAYFYRVTNPGSAVGLFANRNHQALLLTLALPLLALVATWSARSDPKGGLPVNLTLLACAVFIIPLVLVTGSRAGLILLLIGLIGSWFVWRAQFSSESRKGSARKASKRSPRSRTTMAILVAVLLASVALTVAFARAEAIQRLFSEDVSQEIRLRLFPTMLDIANTYMPFGAGFGTFDPVFRMYEPFDNLSPIYINRAHNDLLEIYIEGGLVSIAILMALLAWLGRKVSTMMQPPPPSQVKEWLLARCGAVMLLMQLVASLADYPLRTPAHAAIAAIAVIMISQIRAPVSYRSSTGF